MCTRVERGFVLRWEQGVYWGGKNVCTEVGRGFVLDTVL